MDIVKLTIPYTLTVTAPSLTLPPPSTDADGDGFSVPVDCADNNSSLNPAATEIPGNGVDEDCNPATPDGASPTELACTVSTDKVSYGAQDQAIIQIALQNLTPTLAFTTPSYALTVKDAAGTVLLTEDVTAGLLSPGATTQSVTAFETARHSPGVYTVTVLAGNGTTAGTCTASFDILASSDSPLTGTVSVAPAEIQEGESTTISYTVSNPGNVNRTVDLQINIASLETGEVVTELNDQAVLAVGDTVSGSKTFPTDLQSGGEYMVVLSTVTPQQVLEGVRLAVLNVNRAPVAEAGAGQLVNVGEAAVLDGNGSTDPDGDALTYLCMANYQSRGN